MILGVGQRGPKWDRKWLHVFQSLFFKILGYQQKFSSMISKSKNAQFSIPISLAQPLVTMEQRLTGRLLAG